MSDANKKTIDAYEDGLAEYNAAAIPKVSGLMKAWIDTSLAMLPTNARILEIGSAHGRDADYMEAKGFNVERTDATKSFVRHLIEKGHSARVLNALTDDYGGPFGMIFANAVLLHFNAEQITQVLKKIAASLNDEGILSFSVKIGEGSAWSNVKLKLPRFFTYWKEDDLRALLQVANFNIIFWEEARTGHDNGDWYHIIARKSRN